MEVESIEFIDVPDDIGFKLKVFVQFVGGDALQLAARGWRHFQRKAKKEPRSADTLVFKRLAKEDNRAAGRQQANALVGARVTEDETGDVPLRITRPGQGMLFP